MFRVGIDVGGTFTDLFGWDRSGPGFRTAKVMSTPHDLTVGVFGAIEAARLELAEIETIVHGSTTATNALIERSYPEPAFITTEGFRDTIEMGRPHRKHLYDPYQQRPAPLVRRTNRFTVREKIRASGAVRTPLDEEGVRAAAAKIAARGTRSVAVGLINSYANPAHERRIGELLAEEEKTPANPLFCLSVPTLIPTRSAGRYGTFWGLLGVHEPRQASGSLCIHAAADHALERAGAA